MNVASLELCKELYELSGWGYDGVNDHAAYVGGKVSFTMTSSMNWGKDIQCPAYSLGFLLRKLPPTIPNMQYEFLWRLQLKPFADRGWTIAYENYAWATSHKSVFSRKGYDSDSVAAFITLYADTPEDVACKLAIELFKQGILTRETTPNPT